MLTILQHIIYYTKKIFLHLKRVLEQQRVLIFNSRKPEIAPLLDVYNNKELPTIIIEKYPP